jgi:hypothetical protein
MPLKNILYLVLIGFFLLLSLIFLFLSQNYLILLLLILALVGIVPFTSWLKDPKSKKIINPLVADLKELTDKIPDRNRLIKIIKIFIPLLLAVIFLVLPDEDIYQLLAAAILLIVYFYQSTRQEKIEVIKKIIVQSLLGLLALIFVANLFRLAPENIITDFIANIYLAIRYHIFIATLTLGGFFIYFLTGEKKEEKLTKENISNWKITWPYILGLGIIFIIYLGFSFQNWLFISTGEVKWINVRNDKPTLIQGYDEISPEVVKRTAARCEAYWLAYSSGNIKATFNNSNPNATTCFLHLPGFIAKRHVSLSTYILIARITTVLHNLVMLLFIFYLLSKITNQKQALLATALLGAQPIFIGYSRVFNHDATQGLYAINFILAFWAALKYKYKNYFLLAGSFFALALLTQYKTQFLVPLLFFIPLVYWYWQEDKNILHFLAINLPAFYKTAVLAAIIFMPAVIFFPRFVIDRFFFYPNSMLQIATALIMILFILAWQKPERVERFLPYIRKVEKIFIRLFIIIIIGLWTAALLMQNKIFNQYFYQKTLESYLPALWGALIVLFYSLTPVTLLFILGWLTYYFIKPKIDFSSLLIILFFAFSVFLTLNAFTENVNLGNGFLVAGAKYAFVLFPLLIIGLTAWEGFEKITPAILITIFLAVAVSLSWSNAMIMPFAHNYGNFLLPAGQLNSQGGWGIDTGLVSQYLNDNFSKIKVYHPEGTLEPLVKKNIKVLDWNKPFWGDRPDYIIVTFKKSHRFSKILDFYREYREPVWSIKKNGVIYVGIYKFDRTIDYDRLLRETAEIN